MASPLQEFVDSTLNVRTFSDGSASQKKRPQPLPRQRHMIKSLPDCVSGSESPMSAPPVSQKPKKPAPPTVSPRPKASPADKKFETFPRQLSQEASRPAISAAFNDDSTTEEMHDTSPAPSTLPMARPRTTKPAQLSSSPLAKKEAKVTEATLSDRVSLKGFVQNYSGSLPLRMKVLQGFYGAAGELQTGEIYDVYFKKLAQVVLIEDVSGNKYSVPLNSALQFGLVYDDKNPTFEKVSDLIACTNLPKVVRTTSSYSSGKEESTIYEDEVLVVLGVHEYDTKSKMGLGDVLNALGVKQSKRGLKVLSLDAKEEKIIDEQCIGHFVTDPSLLALYLPEIVETFPKPFPSKACVFLDTESTLELPKLPKSLLSRPVSLKKVKTEVSLVASKVESDSSQSECGASPLLFDIPVSGGFSEVELSVIYDGQLPNRARGILESFDPMKLISLKEANGGRNQKIQAALNSAIRVEHKGDGISLESTCGTKNLTNCEKKTDSIPVPAHPANEMNEADIEKEEQENYKETVHSPPKDPIPAPPAATMHPPSPVRPSVAVRQQLASISAQRHSSVFKQTPSDGHSSEFKQTPSDGHSSEFKQTPSDSTADMSPLSPPATTSNVSDSDNDMDSYEPVDPSLLTSDNQEQDYVTMHPSDYSHYSKVPRPVPAVLPHCNTMALLERIYNLEVQRKKDRRYLDQTASRLSELSEQVQSLRKTIVALSQNSQNSQYGKTAVKSDKVVGSVATQGTIRAEVSETSDLKNTEDNKKFLRGLGVAQVLNLLKAMQMETYAEAFLKEQIDGEVLSELDDSTLEAELGVANKIHRIRLVKVIDGDLSARSLLGL